MKHLAATFAILVSLLPLVSPAAEAPTEPLRLHLSWSATAQQDTLTVTASGWTHCYLWVRPGSSRDGFVGYWGTLFHTGGTKAHRWRYLGDGAPGDFALDPAHDEQPIAYLDAACEDFTAARAVCEFDVYVDAGQVGTPGSRDSEIGLFAADLSDWDPLVFYRVDPEVACGLHSEGFAAGTNVIVAVAGPVATSRTTFGAIKAMYR